MESVSVNDDQKLYVIPASGGGYSCLGFEYADRKMRAVAAWMIGDNAWQPETTPGTLEHYAEYERIMARGAAHAAKTGTRCPAELTPALVGLEGKRVEVTYSTGEKVRFYVGKSMGWMPCHLEIKRGDSIDGGAVYFPEGATVRVVGGIRR